MSASNYLEEKLGSLLLRTQTAWKPSAIAISLHTADPTDVTATAAANECANSGSYARVAVTQSDSNWNAPTTDGVFSNINDITFPSPTGSWGIVTHFGIWDSATYGGGSLLASGALGTSKTINDGDAAPTFTGGAPGALLVTLS
jgi:hypothetical protein